MRSRNPIESSTIVSHNQQQDGNPAGIERVSNWIKFFSGVSFGIGSLNVSAVVILNWIILV